MPKAILDSNSIAMMVDNAHPAACTRATWHIGFYMKENSWTLGLVHIEIMLVHVEVMLVFDRYPAHCHLPVFYRICHAGLGPDQDDDPAAGLPL